MGCRLATYYRKQNPSDIRHLELRVREEEWKTGRVLPIEPSDPSPLLGNISPGSSQLAIDNGMARSPAFAYEAPPTDFLLIRRADGTMVLREVQGTLLAAQQEPKMKASGSCLEDRMGPGNGCGGSRAVDGGCICSLAVGRLPHRPSRTLLRCPPRAASGTRPTMPPGSLPLSSAGCGRSGAPLGSTCSL